jgi:hypothetical protein
MPYNLRKRCSRYNVPPARNNPAIPALAARSLASPKIALLTRMRLAGATWCPGCIHEPQRDARRHPNGLWHRASPKVLPPGIAILCVPPLPADSQNRERSRRPKGYPLLILADQCFNSPPKSMPTTPPFNPSRPRHGRDNEAQSVQERPRCNAAKSRRSTSPFASSSKASHPDASKALPGPVAQPLQPAQSDRSNARSQL